MASTTSISGNNNDNNSNNNISNSTIVRFEANESTRIKMIWSAEDLRSERDPHVTFTPVFSHQIFKEEQIIGYEPLRLNIYMGAGSLTSFIDTNYTIKSKNITNVEKQLVTVMSKTDPPLSTYDSFREYIDEKENNFKPPGDKLHEYTVTDRDTGKETVYEVYFGKISDPVMLRYHEKLQLFVLWYIDGASYIYTNDSNWDIFLIFERRVIDGVKRYGVVGYSTIYNFYHHPECNRSRISQFLVLPLYQRMGHGKHLLNAIYNQYKANPSVYGPVYDITVEDPADNFILLRNTVDIENITKAGLVKHVTANFDLSQDHKELFESIRKQLLITPVQSKICLEIILLSKVIHLPASDANYKKFRVYIKKKLFKQFVGSELDSADKEAIEKDPAKKQELEDNKRKVIIELYKQTEDEYSQSIYSVGLTANGTIANR
ncbi:hypothetical protein SAMD00019534_006950 [Acytostelium subglobosum LB1]|uniref:hypothetical protein n=1 Tax=Acytostelium subglobosum LB1 TaxID=1410327 RepID=UPI000644A741|nr:hypothetical protein SAMD00019534_006950 [Acytostelium subglobosum LB1]GAM17520.1 hypothetical protein SAMD00019534_006950 [Acytostelium subglobosum LB1]|eukprot:XP_012759582.1 hypothetical protein SAMD00019534_006950 [Acytostelium subglobosum LB1]